MGVSFGYFTTSPMVPRDHQQLLSLAEDANQAYDWWCESLWFHDQPDESGNVFGFTKLFRNIDDEVTDTYMAYLDVLEIISFLTTVAQRFQMAWRLEIEGEHFGGVTSDGPDDALQGSIDTFLEMLPGDFEPLRARSREDILEECSDR